MILQFSGIVGRGYSDEGLVFNVLGDGSTLNYSVYRKLLHRQGVIVSGQSGVLYTFPDQEVKKFDTVVLYTLRGTDRMVRDPSDVEIHKFYMGLDAPVWKDSVYEEFSVLMGDVGFQDV